MKHFRFSTLLQIPYVSLTVLLFCLILATNLNAQNVVSVSPLQNALNVPRTQDVLVTLPFEIEPASINTNSLSIHSASSGTCTGTYSLENLSTTIRYNPAIDFTFGDRVIVTVTTGVRSIHGDTLARAFSWEFIVEANVGTGEMPLNQVISLGADGIGAFDVLTQTDMDRDGDVDLVVGDAISYNVAILVNDGTGRFSVSTRFSLGLSIPVGIAAGDFNGDSLQDLVIMAAGLPTLTTWLNNGSGAFSRAYIGNHGDISEDMTVADFNGDNISDVAALGAFTDKVVLFHGDATGSLLRMQELLVGDQPQAITHGDYDHDGDFDVAIADAMDSLFLFINNGRGAFSKRGVNRAGGYPFAMQSADMNGDSTLDIVICNRFERSVTIARNDGSGNFTLSHGPSTGYILADVAVGDVDADGDMDVVASGSLQSVLLTNNGAGQLAVGTLLRQSEGVTLADVNNDGDMDVALASNFSDDVALHRNNNRPTLHHPLPDITLMEDSGILVVAFDLYRNFADVDKDNLVFTATVHGVGIAASTPFDSLLVSTAANAFGMFPTIVTASDTFQAVKDTFLVTVLPVNDAPPAPILISPLPGDTVSVRDTVQFVWHASRDIENDSVTYSLHLLRASVDSLLAATRDTSVLLEAGVLQPGVEYSWYVIASDTQLQSLSDIAHFVGVLPPPAVLALFQNYPNPFNSFTVIRYDLPFATNVNLKIYNLLGQEVTTLVHEYQLGGEKSVAWDGRNNSGIDVGSGMYIYRIYCPGFSSTKKLMLLR
jgi:hypothetical protein